ALALQRAWAGFWIAHGSEKKMVLRYFLWLNLSHSVFLVLISSLCLCVSVVLFSSSRLNLQQLTN
ncbi:MAG: hypothetical protein QG666_389, partial [Euryarchaeota archaeon]|nr:hypothetical protein [Euryarchaeota archaeon]